MNLQEHDKLAGLLVYDDLTEGYLLGYEIRPERVTLLVQADLRNLPEAAGAGLASEIVRVDFFMVHSIKASLNVPVLPVSDDNEEFDQDLGSISRISVVPYELDLPIIFRKRCEVEWSYGSIVLVYEKVELSAIPWPE